MMKRLFLIATAVILASCSSETADVKNFIASNWDATIRENVTDDGTLIGLPYPYSVPCASDTFQEMYYWDTFFTNEGLILSGRTEQALNNTSNIAYLIDRYGFMPNGTRTWYLNRSQPPYFAQMVKAVYTQTGDKAWLREMYSVIQKEYAFWMTHRSTPCGLNRYSSEADDALIREFVVTGGNRLGANFNAMGLGEQQLHKLGRDFAAEAESGWDFTPRFERRCEDFCPLDLNANLYFYETYLAELAEMFGDDSDIWVLRASSRAKTMRELMKAPDGMFYDYDHTENRTSGVVSGAVFNLLAVKMLGQDEADALIAAALGALETPYGVAACAEGDYGYSYQWSYPNSWPPVQYLAERALLNYSHSDDASRIAGNYIKMVCNNYKKTGNLWEKYDLRDGSVVSGVEYDTPSMLGWTAGTFLYSCHIMDK